MKWYDYLELENVKLSFGSFAVFDDIDILDYQSVCEFSKIVQNYLKMKEIAENK